MKDEIKFRKKWNVVASRKLLTNFVCVILFGLLPLFLWAQAPQPPVIQDTIPQDSLLRISVLAPDSTQQILADSLKQAFRDSMQRSAELKSRVNYHARDSIIFDLDGKLLQLYGEVSLDYEDIKLTADRVTIDWGTNTLYAEGTPDTSGQIIGPVMVGYISDLTGSLGIGLLFSGMVLLIGSYLSYQQKTLIPEGRASLTSM